jgi:SAM-dependent methyltransferase
VLDCSCGLGFHTVLFREAGFQVAGSDRSSIAISGARQLAESEGLEIPFFESSWSGLPDRIAEPFDLVFCDALSWTPNRQEFDEALRGFRGAIRPGGCLVFLGAREGAPPEGGPGLLRQAFRTTPRFELDWSYKQGQVQCTKVSVSELGSDWLDRHHLFVVCEKNATRLEAATIRESARWHWALLEECFLAAGFSSLVTECTYKSAGINVAGVAAV